LDETRFQIGGISPRLSGSRSIASHRSAAVCWQALSCTTTGSFYYTLTGVLHALRNAHYLRELNMKALVEIEKEDWARKMQRLLRRACHTTNLTQGQGVALMLSLIALIERCYDTLPRAWQSTKRNPQCSAPSAEAKLAAGSRAGLAINCCCA
jgi:hypothetical protein